MDRVTRLLALLAVAPTAITAAVLSSGLSAELRQSWSDWGLVTAGVIAALLARRRADSRGDRGARGWRGVELTVWTWVVGQTFFAMSAGGDNAWAIASGVAFLVTGLTVGTILLRAARSAGVSAPAILDGLGAASALLGLVWAPLIVDAMAAGPSPIATIPFPAMEIAAVAIGVSILCQLGAADDALRALVVGAGCLLAGDLVLLYRIGHGGFRSGDPTDLLWFVAFAAIGLAAVTTPRPKPSGVHWWHQAVPALPLVAVIPIGVWKQVNGRLDNAFVIGGAISGLAFIVRQVILHRRVIALSNELAADRDRLAASEQRARLLLDYSGDGIMGTDVDGYIVFMNRSAETLLGLEPGAALGRYAHDIMHNGRPDGTPFPRWECELGRAVANGRSHSLDIDWWSRTDGTFVPVEYQAHPVFRDGTVWGSVVTFHDVTARIASADALAAQERRWRTLVLNSSDVVVVLDADGQIEFTTPSIERVMGYGRTVNLGQSVASFVHPEDLEAVSRDVLWLQSQPGGSLRTSTYRFRHADGRWLWMEAIATNLLDDPGVRGIVCNLRDVTDRCDAEAALRHQATHDSLTGLPNRTALHDWIATRTRRGEQFGLVLLDLDGFKEVNDALGHTSGDELLRRIAGRLLTRVRDGDLVVRLGGDEFAVAFPNVADPTRLELLARRVLAAFDDPVEVAGWSLPVISSAGGTVADPTDHLDHVLQRADIAMYRAKRSGSTYATYGGEDEQDRLLDLELTADLRRALESDGLDVWYQAQFDAATGLPVGVEALARWRHFVHGDIPPSVFVPLAERAGLIGSLTSRVLDRAAQQAARWQADGMALPVAVNIGAGLLKDRDFAASVLRRLAVHGVPPSLLTLEITEEAVADPAGTVLSTLHTLRDAGVRIAIDDFGTGYSSLSYLKQLPVDTLKIDRAFVAGVAIDEVDRRIVAAICELAASLHLAVVGEGVETVEASRRLAEAGCHFQQGFLYHCPAPAADTTATLARAWSGAVSVPEEFADSDRRSS